MILSKRKMMETSFFLILVQKMEIIHNMNPRMVQSHNHEPFRVTQLRIQWHKYHIEHEYERILWAIIGRTIVVK